MQRLAGFDVAQCSERVADRRVYRVLKCGPLIPAGRCRKNAALLPSGKVTEVDWANALLLQVTLNPDNL